MEQLALEKTQNGVYSTQIGSLYENAMNSTALGDALFTKSQQRVLGLLYANPDKSLYTNEIVRRANMGRGTIRRELGRLVSVGLLIVSHEGNQHHYKANPDNPIFDELRGIIRKTFGVADVISEALTGFDKEIELAFIYGSIAKGEDKASSDIDLLVVSESVVYSKLMLVLSEVGESLGRVINPSIYSMSDIRKKIDKENAFLTRILEQPKLWVKGSDDDIKEFR